MKAKYDGLFDGWEIAVAKKMVNEFQQKWRHFRKDDREDLLQESLFCWFNERDKYDPERGASRETYMSRIVKYRLLKIREKAYAEKRRLMYGSESLDEFINPDDNSSSANKKNQPSTFIEPGLGIDLATVFKKLTPERQQICAMLREEDISILQISKRLKKNHNYVYREVQRLRQIFEEEGLEGYLEKNKKF